MKTFEDSCELRLLHDIRDDILDLVMQAFRREGHHHGPKDPSQVRLLELIDEKAADVQDRVVGVIGQDLMVYEEALERALEDAVCE
jgi:hypothetical protein